MKKFISLFLSAVCLGTCASVFAGCGGDGKYPVYLIIGQSNANGNGRIEHLADTSYVDKEYENVLIHCGGTSNSTVNGKLLKVSTKEGQGSTSTDRFGIEVGLADFFTSKKYNAGLIKCGFDGSSINLNNTSFGTWWTEISEIPEGKKRCYSEFLVSVATAMQQFKDAGYDPVIKGAIWLQGESNAGDSTYAEDLDKLINKIRTDLSLPELYFVAGTISYVYPGSYQENCAVNVAIRDLKNKENCDFVESGIYPTNAADRYHWTGTNLVDIGKLFANKMYDKFGK